MAKVEKKIKKCTKCRTPLDGNGISGYCDNCYGKIWDAGFESTTQHAEEITRKAEIEDMLDKGFKAWHAKRKKLARSKKFTKEVITQLIDTELKYLEKKGRRMVELLAKGAIEEDEIYSWMYDMYGYNIWWDDKSSWKLVKVEDFTLKKVKNYYAITAQCSFKHKRKTHRITMSLKVYPQENLFGKQFDISLLNFGDKKV